MLNITLRLLDGDQQLPEQFLQAKSFWQDYFSDKQDWSVEQFRTDFGKIQPQARYCRIFPDLDYTFAKTTLALTCIGSLYNDGWKENRQLAIRVAHALLRNTMSGEVKQFAPAAIRLFELDQYDAALSIALNEAA